MSAVRPSDYMRTAERRIPDPWGLNSQAGEFHILVSAPEGRVEAADDALSALEQAVALCAGLPILEEWDVPPIQLRTPDGPLTGWESVFFELGERTQRYAEVTPELVLQVLTARVVDGPRYLELACHWAVCSGATAVAGNTTMFIVSRRRRQADWHGEQRLQQLARRFWKAVPTVLAEYLLGAAVDVAVGGAVPLLDEVIGAPAGSRPSLDPSPEYEGLRVRAQRLREAALIMATYRE